MTQADAMPVGFAALDFGPDDVTPAFVTQFTPTSRIVWATPSAYRLFGVQSLDELGDRVLRADERAHAFAGWLHHLGSGPELGRVTMGVRASELLSASCVAIPLNHEGQILVRVHAAPSVSFRPTSTPDVSTQSAGLGNAQPIRVLWQTDGDGIVTHLTGMDDCPSDLRIVAVGDDAASRLQTHAPEFADRLRHALQHREALGLTRVSWPRPEANGAALLEIGCTARPGLSGLRGFMLVHAARSIDVPVEPAIAGPPILEGQPKPEPSAEAMEDGQRAAVPPVENTPDATLIDKLPEFEHPVSPLSSASGPRESIGNVVHFPVMRTAANPATTELQSEPDPDTTVEVDAPRWSEQPSQGGAEPPEELTADEQDAFAHIARVLGTRPSVKSDLLPEVSSPKAFLADTFADDLFTALPHGLLLRRGDRVDANPALFQRLGDGTAAAFQDRFRGRDPTAPGQLTQVDGTPVTTEAYDLQWGGASARLLVALPSAAKDSNAIPPKVMQALDVATNGFLLLDASGLIAVASPMAGALFGSASENLVGRSVADLLPNHGVSDWDQVQGGRRWNLDGKTSAGETVPLTVGVAPLGTGVLCILSADRRERAPSTSPVAAQENVERGSTHSSALLARISHEVRTPLNAILGFAEIVRDERLGPVGNSRYLEYLRDIHAAGTHVMNLVNDLLDLSRIEAGCLELRLQAVDANAVVQACVGTLQAQAQRERVIMRLSLAPHLPLALADERSFRQIVLNLLSNAIKFNEPGGQVIVSTALVGRESVAIRIRDTGIGMTDDEVATAMEPFSQLSTTNRTGSGLGLPLTKALVEANCASMAFKSSRGQGTLVEVLFPVVEAETLSLPAQ